MVRKENPMFRVLKTISCVAMLSALCASCALFGGGKKDRGALVSDAPVSAVDAASYEAGLHKLVSRQVEAAGLNRAEDQNRIIRRKPYFYKEYAIYTDTSGDIPIEMHESESITRPFLADVRLPKQRFSTRLHRKREEARKDDSFLRDTGMETLTYELRNGRWTRVGSLFVSEKTEEKVNGEWVPRREEVERVVAEEERRGWFGRTWTRLTGGE